MGTNFYVRGWKGAGSMDPKYHIGKRSAAGVYCWDCGVTLCKGGNEEIHYSCSHPDPFCRCKWHDECPVCGGKRKQENLEDSTAGRELGFNNSIPGKKTGVSSCCSFTWCMDPETFLKRRVTIWNEYGDTFSHEEFLKILDECPIQYRDTIGKWFS